LRTFVLKLSAGNLWFHVLNVRTIWLEIESNIEFFKHLFDKYTLLTAIQIDLSLLKIISFEKIFYFKANF